MYKRQNLLSRLQHPFAGTHIINGAAEDIESERVALNDYISQYGPLDVSVLGIGMNGHLGFNENGVDFDLDAHIIPLSETTLKVMTDVYKRQVPSFALTFAMYSSTMPGTAS